LRSGRPSTCKENVMKEVEKKEAPEVSGGYSGPTIPALEPDYPQNPIGPTCPPTNPVPPVDYER